MKNNKKMFALLFVSCITCLLMACGQVHYAHKVFGKLPETGALNEISYEIIQGEYEKSEYSVRGYHIYKASDSEYYYTICSGERPSAGYAIEVSDIKVDEQNVWEVTVKETEPENHYAVAESLTYPNCTLVLSGKPSGIVFRPANGKWFGKLSEKGSLNGISYEIVPGEYHRSEYSARGIISERDEEGDCYYTICQGEQRTGGYAVEIADIKANDQNEWEVIVMEIQPGRDSTVTTEVTYPYCILVLSSEPSGISFFNTDGEKFSNITSPDSSDPMETSDAASQGT